MKSVLISEYKKNKLAFIVINVITIIIVAFYIWGSYGLDPKRIMRYDSYIFSIFSLIYIFLNFSYNKKVEEIDFYNSTNIPSKKIFLSKYLATIIEIFLSILFYYIFMNLFLGLYSLGFNYSAIKELDFDFLKFFLGTLIQLLFTIVFASWIIALFFKANSILDGIIYAIIGGFLPYLFELALSRLLWIFNVPTSFVGVLLSPSYYSIECLYGGLSVFELVLLILFSILSFTLIGIYYHLSDRFSGEKINHVDNDIFGYNSLIPATMLLSVFYFEYLGTIYLGMLLVFVSAVLQYVGFAIKNRNIVILKCDLLNIAITTLVSFIICLSIAR